MKLYETGIRPLIDKHIEKLSEQERNYGNYWSASSAGVCYRHQIFQRLGVPMSPEMQEKRAIRQRTFSAGHIFHEWIQGITKDAGLSVTQELELQDEELMIRGHFDDLVLVGEDMPDTMGAEGEYDFHHAPDPDDYKKKLILYEYKTVHSGYFNYSREEISYYHKHQLGTYLYMLRKLRPDPIKDFNLTEARRLNISKDDLRLSENQLLWSGELKNEILSYWRGLNDAWKSRKIPPCTCHLHDGGFRARRSKKGKISNDFFYNETPCSMEWFNICKEKGTIKAYERKEQ